MSSFLLLFRHSWWLHFEEETYFSKTKHLSITKLFLLHMKSSKDSQNLSRTSITFAAGQAQKPSWQTWGAEGIFQPYITQPPAWFFAPWVSWCLKRQIGSNGKTFLWLSVAFAPKIHQAARCHRHANEQGLSLRLTFRNTLDATSPVTPTKTQLSWNEA